MIDLKLLQKDINRLATAKGFWSGVRSNLYEKLALIHTEVSEATECLKKGLGREELGSELADILIRTLDLAEYFGFDMADELLKKHEVNKTRPYLNGSKGFIDDTEND